MNYGNTAIAKNTSESKKRRNVWTDDEIFMLLNMMKEKKIQGELDGKRLRNKEIFKSLEEPMKLAGFRKDASMIQIKFKNLKGEYYRCKRHNENVSHDSVKFTFYNLMDELLDHCPPSKLTGVSTSELQITKEDEESIPPLHLSNLDISTTNSGEKKRRNVWTDDEILLLLDLMKEKKILGLLDGKRFRNKEIFESLEKPMKQAGFIKDAAMIQIKFKNLKGEYFRCKRQNDMSGSDPAKFAFFGLMDELLDQRSVLKVKGENHSEQHLEKDEEESILPLYSFEMDMNTISTAEKKKRNVWKEEEISLLLYLMKEKKILDQFDGKQLWNKEVFQSLEEPMKQAGFLKDAAMMQVKFKNLKGEYYKYKRDKDQSGSDSATFAFYDIMDDLLNHLPALRLKDVDTDEQETVDEEEHYPARSENFFGIPSVENPEEELVQPKIEVSDYMPEPSFFTTPSSSSSNTPTTTTALNFRSRKKVSLYQNTLEKFVTLQEEMNNTLKVIATEMKRSLESDEAFLNNLFRKEEAVLTACTNQILEGLKSLQRHKKRNRRRRSSSEST